MIFAVELMVLLIFAAGLFVMSKVSKLNSDPIEDGAIIVNELPNVESEGADRLYQHCAFRRGFQRRNAQSRSAPAM